MSRWLLLSLLLMPLALSGCSMCCGPYDYEYPVFQHGKYVRQNPEYGRVGSIYSDPNANQDSSPVLTNQDVPRDDVQNDMEESEFEDPEFNRIGDEAGEGESEGVNDVDTSARIPRRNLFDRSWR